MYLNVISRYIELHCIALYYTRTYTHTHTVHVNLEVEAFQHSCQLVPICAFVHHSFVIIHVWASTAFQTCNTNFLYLFVLLIDLKRGWFISPGGVDRCAPYCAILSMHWSLMEVWTRFRSCRVGQLQPLQTPWRPLFKFLFRRHFCNLLYESWTDGECVSLLGKYRGAR